MATNTGWIAGRGQGLTYASAGFTAANFNTLAVGSVVVASSATTNTTALDLYADVSFSLTIGSTVTTAASFFSLYVLPLNQDGTTYGDGIANGTAAPSAAYLRSTVGVRVVTANSAVVSTFEQVRLPPGNFKFAIVNNAVVLNAAAAATVSYRTYNESLNS